MSKFCAHCGTQLPDEANVCTNCGTPVADAPAAPDAAETAAPVNEAPAPAAENDVPVVDNAAPKAEKAAPVINVDALKSNVSKIASNVGETATVQFNKVKSDKKLLGIVIGAAAIVLVAVIILVSSIGGGYKSAINNYFDVMIEGKANKIEKLAPKQYWDYLEEEEDVTLEDLKEDYEDSFEDQIDQLEDEYGKNYKFSYKITDKDDITTKKFKNIQENLKDKYDIPKKSVTKGYKVDVELSIKGSEDEDENDTTLYVVKIDGDWYVTTESGRFLTLY